VVHELEVAAYGNHDMPPPVAELPPLHSAPQVSDNMMALGTVLALPIEEILACCMAPNMPAEDVLLDLFLMLSKASPLYLFGKIVGFMEKCAGHTFQNGVTLPC
jgi:hypothetical protein